MKTKTILVRDWKKMETVSAPTATKGMIKKDRDGSHWEWVRANKRVEVRLAK